MTTSAPYLARATTLARVWEPLTIRNVELRNRILQPAHSSQHGDPRDHVFSARQIAYFAERAKGGVALSITETVAAARSALGSFHHIVDAYSEQCIPSMEALGKAVHAHGGRIMVQLASMGVHDKGRMFIDHAKPVWGASNIPSLMHNEIPQVMAQPELAELAHDFGVSAANVQRAGLDGVELHGAHSYGLGQFLSPTYNRRHDAYGGSPTKRCRLMLDCAEEVRARVGSDFVVGVRLSWDEFLGAGGITPEQSEEQLEVLAASGLFDFFNISAGGYHTIHMALPSMEGDEQDGWLTPFSKRAKEIVGTRGHVFTVGKVRDLALAEAILADGAADMVAMARQLLTDPFTVAKTRENRAHEIIRCNGCNECAGRLWENRELVCTLNPVSGREAYWGEGSLEVVAAGARRKILVVGGGPAGLKAAAIAAKRGHHVTLLEAEAELGGHLRLLARLPGLSEWSVAIDNLSREIANAGVTVHTSTRASADVLRTADVDCLVFATGATHDKSGLSLYRPERDGIPGAELAHVLDTGTAAQRALVDPEALGRHVLILDETGAHLPFALAELLARAGVHVEVVSPRLYAGERLFRNTDMLYMFPRLRKLGVAITSQHFVEAIRPQQVDVYDIWLGPQHCVTRQAVDTVVLSILKTPNDSLYQEACEHFGDVRRIGDMVAPRDVTAAIYEGEKLGRAL